MQPTPLRAADFGRQVDGVRNGTGEVVRSKIFGAWLTSQNAFAECGPSVQQKLIEVLCMFFEKAAMAVRTTNPNEFYLAWRIMLQEEMQRGVADRLSLVPRLSAWLVNKEFSIDKLRPLMRVARSPQEDLNGALPKIYAANMQNALEPDREVPLYFVLAGMKIQ